MKKVGEKMKNVLSHFGKKKTDEAIQLQVSEYELESDSYYREKYD